MKNAIAVVLLAVIAGGVWLIVGASKPDKRHKRVSDDTAEVEPEAAPAAPQGAPSADEAAAPISRGSPTATK